MRMNQSTGISAKDIVNTWSEEKLGSIFREYGEERSWRMAARAIVENRPLETTTQLAKVLAEKLGSHPGMKRHVATKIFQALRIAVNLELDAVQEGVTKALSFLAPNGIMGAISFHSLEDRIVKTIFKEASVPIIRIVGETEERIAPLVKLVTKKPILPSFAEIKRNPRSRSAKLRAVRKDG